MLKQTKFYLLVLAVLAGLATLPVVAQQKSSAKKQAPKSQSRESVPDTRSSPNVRAASQKEARMLQYVPDEAIVILGIQPSRVINADRFKGLIEAAEGQEVLKGLLGEFENNTGVRIEQIEEIGLVMDAAGLEDMSNRTREQAERVQRLNGLKQIALAMHMFHDAHNFFPASDGYRDNKGHLSWRVHLLPYLEQANLYNKFHLDEPWDSDHNKQLIDKMPDIFRTTGVDEAGKTAYHVMTGEGTPFGREVAPRIRDFKDGTSNTLMAVLAGADKAEIWTKPGGLEIETGNPLAALGEVGQQFAAAFADGYARFLPTDIETSELLHLIQHQDGNVVESYFQAPPSSGPLPGIIFLANVDFDKNTVLTKLPPKNDGKIVKLEGRDAYVLPGGNFLTFVDSKTLLMGPENTLKSMLSPRGKSGEAKVRFEELYPASDIAAVLDPEPLEDLVQRVSEQIPMAALIPKIVGLSAAIDTAGTSESHVNLKVEMKDAASAQQLIAIAMGGFQMARAQALGQLSGDSSSISDDMVTLLTEILDSVKITAVEKTVELDVPKVKNPEQFFKDVTPAFRQLVRGIEESQKAAARRTKTIPLRQIGLAFHNYHDIFNGFPSYCAPQSSPEENNGLSWRVYLLPLLGESALYEEFHLDEPWDSEHNKTLIERMPKVYQCEGVEKPGRTCYHVFTGECTPFGNDEPIRISSITDGTSNTIMVVQAGPDEADVWTKPTGIEFKPEQPKAGLGQLAETFLILLCDGSVREVSSKIDDATLSRLIQHRDGELVGEF